MFAAMYISLTEVTKLIRRALVLAAGLSRRIGKPKQLLRISGYPLIWYPLSVLHSLGVGEVCIVTRREIADELKLISQSILGPGSTIIVLNDKPEKENGFSLLLGLTSCFLEEYSYVSMSDHIYSAYIPAKLMDRINTFPYVIAGDKFPRFIAVDEATKLSSNGFQGFSVGKNIRYWSHIDSGVHLVHPTKLLHIIANTPLISRPVIKLNEITNNLARTSKLGVAEFASLPWTEVDTVSDIEEIEKGKRREVIIHVLEWLRR